MSPPVRHHPMRAEKSGANARSPGTWDEPQDGTTAAIGPVPSNVNDLQAAALLLNHGRHVLLPALRLDRHFTARPRRPGLTGCGSGRSGRHDLRHRPVRRSTPATRVTVVATSPNLQGDRVGVSDSNGVYYLQSLPSGSYTVSFELSGFQSATRETINVRVGQVASIDAVMSVAAVTETVTVTAEVPSVLTSPLTSKTFSKRDVDALPAGRRPLDIAELAPGTSFASARSTASRSDDLVRSTSRRCGASTRVASTA